MSGDLRVQSFVMIWPTFFMQNVYTATLKLEDTVGYAYKKPQNARFLLSPQEQNDS